MPHDNSGPQPPPSAPGTPAPEGDGPDHLSDLDYAARGWRVLPLKPRDKAPLGELVSHGWKDATTDPDTIARWWARYPDANVGIACGASGLLVLDIDPRNGGDDSLRDLEEQRGPLPNTVRCLTGGGGVHYYFRRPVDAPVGDATPWPGIEIKAEGYVVAPPSIHPDTGREYAWDATAHPDDMTPVEAPTWIVDAMTTRAEAAGPAVHLTSADLKTGVPSEKLVQRLEDRTFRATYLFERADLKNDESAYDLSLASTCVNNGWKDAEIAALIVDRRE